MRALVLEDAGQSSPRHTIKTLKLDQLPRQGNVLVKVLYSGVNYKDGLAVTGRGKIIRAPYPFVPGIDLCGEVVETDSARYSIGDIVIGTGWQIGEAFWGGYSEYQWMEDSWLVSLPSGMTPEESMVMGTAGFTAMLAVMALEENGIAGGEVIVTGASGGVGSIAVLLLSQSGHTVVASTGKQTAHQYLTDLGASRIIDRSELSEGARRPMDNAKWVGCIDSVGGTILEAIISQMDRHAGIAACGLAGGHQLNTTVFPFILRGVNLLGIDSNTCPIAKRVEAWTRLSTSIASNEYDLMKNVIGMEQIAETCDQITQGAIRGRTVVKIAEE